MKASLVLLLLGALGCWAVEVKRPRGVSLSNRGFYDDSKPFTCLDGSRTIPFDRVNDDYCDCADGTDEPGTSACSNGRFHCTNAGYKPQYIPSSRINDGICDCCDTTDEYNSGVVCENTCREMGRKAREELQVQAETAREGFRVKQLLIEEARKGREEKQTKLQDMVQSRQALQAQVDSLRTEKEAAEQPEQEAKDAHKKSWEESREAEKVEMDKQRSLEVFTELDQDSDGMLAGVELLSHPELDVDGDGAMSDQEAQSLLGGASSVDVSSFQESVWPQIQEKYKSEVPPSKAQEAEPEMPPYDETTQALIDAAQKARSQYEEAEKSLHDMEDTIKRLEKEISLDFGPSGEFSYLYGECYELSTSEYVYSLCPFNRVTQKPKHGGSETNLGSWGSWAGPEDNKFSSMKYEHGTSCWQGPNRSTQVKLSCGKDTVVTSTSEPSRCEYLMEFFTPAACHPPPEVLPGDHDEL
ncbi:protein kinase C substrate 80K-H S homeolog isoform X2 [Xenopus laevis]|uniref:Glucosidase 2 subunit beta n=1 Tax=Xenopus laevis TaxID=8355 RepID=A0A8J1MP94_XENLA|nr:protein kinase C substrate 80K-H S homeolog isoform X2 [Xenopus laevis]